MWVGISGRLYGSDYKGVGVCGVAQPLTARSTARRSLARRRCSGTRRLPDSHRSWRTCGGHRERWGRVPSPAPPTPAPALTGFRGTGGDRRRAGSPRGSRRWHPRRNRGHIGHRNPPLCCAGIPEGTHKYLGVHTCDRHSAPTINADGRTHGAGAALGVAALGVAVALAELAVPQVQPPPGARVTGGTVLPGQQKYGVQSCEAP